MVKLRLRRKGRIHHPVYDIIAIDSRKRRDGAYIERLGYYDPNNTPSVISIDPDRAVYWLGVGAEPTPIVKNLLGYEGILLRKALAMQGRNQVEIEAEVAKHKEAAKDRFFRQKELRKKRKEKKEAPAEEVAEAPIASEPAELVEPAVE